MRVGKMAKYLHQFGHEVKVISSDAKVRCSDLSLEISSENVVYTKYFKISPERLRDNIRDVVVSSYGLYKFFHKCWRILISLFYFPDAFIGWIPYAIQSIRKILLAGWKPDIVIVSASPYSSLLIGSYVSKKFKIPWVADMRDLWTDNQCYPYGRFRKWLEERIERKVFSAVSGFVTVSEPLAEKIKSKFNAPVEVVTNGFDPSDYNLQSDPAVKSSCQRVLEIIYIGSMYDGFQDPELLFSALKRFSNEEVVVSFYGTESPRSRHLVRKMEIEDKVVFYERVSYLKSLNIQKNADILLFLLWTDIQEKGVYTGKIFEYLGARRTILGIGPDSGVAADLIKERNLGVILNSVEDIYLQIKKWIEEKKVKGFIPSLPYESSCGFSREEQTRKLEQFIKKRVNK